MNKKTLFKSFHTFLRFGRQLIDVSAQDNWVQIASRIKMITDLRPLILKKNVKFALPWSNCPSDWIETKSNGGKHQFVIKN